MANNTQMVNLDPQGRPLQIMDAQTQDVVQLDGSLASNAGGDPRVTHDASPDTSAIEPSDLDRTDDDLLNELDQNLLGTNGVNSRVDLMQQLTQAETQVATQQAELQQATVVVERLQTAGQEITSEHAGAIAVLQNRDTLIQEQRQVFAAEHARQEAEIQRASQELVQVQQAASTMVQAHGQAVSYTHLTLPTILLV